MNVLIYAGPEALQKSVAHSLASLRSILLPQYSVQAITHQALNSQPWQSSCALLVIPQCNGRIPSATSASVKIFVESGGSLLGFGVGAISSDRELGNAASISSNVLLGFFDKSSNTYVYLTQGSDQDTPQTLALQTSDNEVIEGIYSSSLSQFSGFDGRKNTSVLARFSKGDSAAGLKCSIGKGRLAVWAPNLEVPVTKESSSSVLTVVTTETVETQENRRLDLLKRTLLELSLRLPTTEEGPVLHPLPQFLTSNPSKNTIVPAITDFISSPSPGSQLSVFKDDNDTFHFHHSSEGATLLKDIRGRTATDPSEWQPKHIVLCPSELPSREETPLFDLSLYYDSLTEARTNQGCPSAPDPWGCGEALFYSEVVTSTQTMLDKNPHFLSRLPTPLVSLASYQLAGRGRGSNIWLSPAGCLQFSVLLRVSLASFPANKLVFIQYLFALAVVEACRDENVLGRRGDRVRLKWPNDVYVVTEGEKKKIGGILVNTSFSGGNVDIVIGCGVNVLNAAPIFSLAQLLPPDERHTLTIEKTVSNILARFEKMWDTFVKERGSFDSFMDLYLERWLHSDQLVTLTTVTPHQPVRIVGITPDHGLLRTMPERSGWSSGTDGFIDLQPDGNSYDLMAGLIKSKT